ncbi:hypothetical protein SAMN04488491_0576 [Psychrobacter sp. LV10R520-6]|nr:hypothetical protein SAMN04488491_0576 [Psychrobacter sp. LV10R520-6]
MTYKNVLSTLIFSSRFPRFFLFYQIPISIIFERLIKTAHDLLINVTASGSKKLSYLL